MANNGEKGKRYERDIVKVFKKCGFKHAKSSRQASRLYDDCKIDIHGLILPTDEYFMVQCKSGYKSNRPKPDRIFLMQKEMIKKHLPEVKNYIPALFHKLDGYKEENHIVSLRYKDFMVMFKHYLNDLQRSASTESELPENLPN